VKDSKTQIFQVGAEGGSITLYKIYDEDTDSYRFFHNVQEMAYEDLDFEATNRDSEFSHTLIGAFQKLQQEFAYVWSMHPTFVGSEVKELVISFLKEHLVTERKDFSSERWEQILKLDRNDLRK